jgi:hypothetical protein
VSALVVHHPTFFTRMLKLSAAWGSSSSAAAAAAEQPAVSVERWRNYCLGAANAATTMPVLFAERLQASAEGGDAAAAAATAAGPGAASCLPWLVLFGRCCLQWGLQLQAALSQAGADAEQQLQQAVLAAVSCPNWQLATSHPIEILLRQNAGSSVFNMWTDCAQEWLCSRQLLAGLCLPCSWQPWLTGQGRWQQRMMLLWLLLHCQS